MFKYLSNQFKEWLINCSISEETAKIITDYTAFILIILLSIIVFFITKTILLKIVHALSKKSITKWDDILIQHKVFKKLSYLVPAYIIHVFTPLILSSYPTTITVIQTCLSVYMIIIVLIVINSFLNAVSDIYQDFTIAKSKPIKGYVQVIKIIIFLIGGIIIISTLIHKSPFGLLGGLGAFTAILMLIFKDPILGFVGGIQLSVNNMVKPGDWIVMPRYGADGTVIDIALTTVKVQNWDKTISTIPTYSLITDSVKNWRGMEESGGRRIKRSVNINTESIKFCTPEMLERFSKYEYVSEYINKKEQELNEYNSKRNIDNSVLVNGRRQTNIGVFRAYLKGYLKNHPKINNNMTFLIRQLQSNELGLPIEIYVFSKIQEWAMYEDIQSDIFDHIFSVIPQFELEVFQNPSGSDFKYFVKK
ncbi:MAG: mechanosensitive ion channel family protein [Bacteroidales bacterium]|nr:mechanosensitive ion channel family protein [Bacteroidales bacterium]